MEFTEKELKNEIWKDIPNYEGSYQASSLGRLRRILLRDGKIEHSSLMKLCNHGRGYYCTRFSKNNIKKIALAHRMVAMAFIENNDHENKWYINHKDGNKKNNRVENLEWVTPKENSAHAIENGLMIPSKRVIKNDDILKMNDAIKKTINHYNLSESDLKKKTRKRKFVEARQMIFRYLYANTELPIQYISKEFSIHWATIIHHVFNNRIMFQVSEYEELFGKYETPKYRNL